MKSFLLIIFISFTLSANAILDAKQLIVVTTKEINATIGKLQKYEKDDSKFVKVGLPIDVFVGRNGLGWGIGLHTIPSNAKYIKKEGDGRAPMGIFKLQNAFGYDDLNIEYNYKKYSKNYHCVDDVNSMFYNSIVDTRRVNKDYKSFEYMKLNSDYYKYGIVVDHNNINNSKKSQKGSGSCIFIHIKNRPTAGCSAVNLSSMKSLIMWLKKDSNPLLIQGTKSVVKELFNSFDH